jgi:hypothetical protein
MANVSQFEFIIRPELMYFFVFNNSNFPQEPIEVHRNQQIYPN